MTNMAQEVVDSQKLRTLLDEANEYTRKLRPEQVNTGMTQQPETQGQQQPEDQNFMKSVQMLPKEEQDAALAQYLSSGGVEAYRDYMAQRRYLEDPQAAARREAKDRRNQRLISAMNMVGALGNFVQAGAQTDGRSVPVANTTEAYNKKLEAERKIRNENLAQANALGNQYRQMAGGIIKQGYQNVEDRAKLVQQERIAQAKLDLQAQAAANRALNDQRNYDLKQQKLGIDQEMMEYRKKLINAQAAKAMRVGAASSKDPEFDKNNVCISDGTNNYIIPKTKWVPENIAKAWSLMSPELQQQAFDMILMEISSSGGDANEALNMWNTNKSKFLATNSAQMRMVIGILMGSPGSENMMAYLKTLASSGGAVAHGGGNTQGGGGSRRNGTRGSRGGGSGGGASTSSEDDV